MACGALVSGQAPPTVGSQHPCYVGARGLASFTGLLLSLMGRCGSLPHRGPVASVTPVSPALPWFPFRLLQASFQAVPPPGHAARQGPWGCSLVCNKPILT